MIRTLQSAGPALKIILGGMLLIICAGMIITLIPGGLGSSFGIGAPPRGIVAEAHHIGLRVSDAELRDELQHGGLGATLFPDGKFVGTEEYENLVQRNF